MEELEKEIKQPRVEFGQVEDPVLGWFIYINGLPFGEPYTTRKEAESQATNLQQLLNLK